MDSRYGVVKINELNMEKILKVVKPFFVMEEGDTFQYSDKDNMYVSSFSIENNEDSDDMIGVTSSYNSEYRISKEYAGVLVANGFLVEVHPTNKAEKTPFVNIFDKIENLLAAYTIELGNVDTDMEGFPECVKTEKRAVLTNLIKLLKYLNSLKK